MRTFLKVLGVLVVLVLVIAAGVYLWAGYTAERMAGQTFEVHSVDFQIPFPLTLDEITALGPSDDAQRLAAAQAKAVERGKHLVTARYPCRVCHGENFGGGFMLDAFPIGTFPAPNLTTGQGSRTLTYTARDWDRTVRHGVLPSGKPAVMPSEDFLRMSDQELSDIVSYIRSLPPVNNEVAKYTLGPLGKYLVATGQLPLSATLIKHDVTHPAAPPAASASAEFGSHLAGVCVGCHRQDLSGGPIPGGDPSWPPARNVTPAPGALKGWTFEQFVAALRDGKRPDGTALRDPMTLMQPLAKAMTDTEVRALWAFFQSLEPIAPTAN